MAKTKVAQKAGNVKQTTADKITDEIYEMLAKGETYRAIAAHFDVSLTRLAEWLSRPEHSARIQASLRVSADTFADKAEEVLKTIGDQAMNGEITRCRELAHHYRWKAAKRAPTVYGDKGSPEDATPPTPPPNITINIPPSISAKYGNEKPKPTSKPSPAKKGSR